MKQVVAENTSLNQAESVVSVQEFRRPDLNPNPNLHQDASLQTTTNPPLQQVLITNPNNTTISAEMDQNTNTTTSHGLNHDTTIFQSCRPSTHNNNSTSNHVPPPSGGQVNGRSVDSIPQAVSINGNDWWQDDMICNIPIDGIHQQKSWSVRSTVGESFGPGADSNIWNARSRLDYFLMMMPQSALADIVRYTNQQLNTAGKNRTTTGEMFKFFGVLILATKFEFIDRRSLWKTTAPSKYIPTPNFGRTGIYKNRFDDIFISFQNQIPSLIYCPQKSIVGSWLITL